MGSGIARGDTSSNCSYVGFDRDRTYEEFADALAKRLFPLKLRYPGGNTVVRLLLL